MDVTKLIVRDHGAIEHRLVELASHPDQKVVDGLCEELEVQAQAEEDAVYPHLAGRNLLLSRLVAKRASEHREIRLLIDRIRRARSDDLAPLVRELAAALRAHARDEESHLLPRVREALPTRVLEQLAVAYEAAKTLDRGGGET